MPELEPSEPSLPAGPPSAPRPFFLKRAWVGWTVALLVAAGGATLAPWLIGEREDLSQELASLRRELGFERDSIAFAEDQIDEHRKVRDDLRDALDLCSEAVRSQLGLVKAAIGYFEAFQGRDRGAVDAAFQAFSRLRKPSNEDLRTCHKSAQRKGLP